MADRSVTVKLRADVFQFNRTIATSGAATRAFVKDLESADSRMANIVQTAMALGPAFVPLGGAGVTALTGLTNQLAFAAAGAGVTALAFNGVGDALEALNTYQLEPTAANFEKLQESVRGLGPAAQEFVRFLDEVTPKLQRIRQEAQEGLLPGAQEGLEEFLKLTPRVRSIVSEIATTTGDLLAEAGDNLNDPRWRAFFRFLDAEARPTLLTLGRTAGNLAEGLANVWMAFDPLNDQFAGGLLEWTRDFAEATRDLDDNEGFQEFLEYVERVGPKAVETLGSLGATFGALVAAAAPIGEASLPIIQALAEVIEAIAESPAGPVLVATAAGLSAVSRAVALFNAANGSAMAGLIGAGPTSGSFNAQIARRVQQLKAAAVGIGGITLAMTDLDEKAGLSNTAMFALLGTLAGPLGAATGGAVGFLADYRHAQDEATEATREFHDLLRDGSAADLATEYQRLYAQLVDIGTASGVFDFIGDGLTTALDPDRAIAIEKHLDQLRSQFQTLESESGGIASALAGNLAPALGMTADQLGLAADEAGRLTERLERLDSFLSKRASLRDYQAALDEFRKGLRDTGKSFDINTEKGRENQQRLDEIASTAIRVAENMEGLDRIRVFQTAIGDIRSLAKSFNLPERATDDLIKRLQKLAGQNPKPKVDVEDGPAKDKLTDLDRQLNRLDRINARPHVMVEGAQAAAAAVAALARSLFSLKDKTVHVNVIRQGKAAIATGGAVDHIVGPVRGPGGPEQDMVDAKLSHGEYVVKTAAVNKYGIAMFDDLNAMRYAEGGSYPRNMSGRSGAQAAFNIVEIGRAAAALEDLEETTKRATRTVEDHSKQVEKNKQFLAGLRDKRAELREAAASPFQGDIFGGGLQNAFDTLEANRNDARSMKAALQRAKKLGLSGAAFKALAASGDVGTATELDTRAEVRKFEQLYGQRERATTSLGRFAGDAAFGKAIERLSRASDRQEKTLDRLDKRLAHLSDDVERGAARGTARGTAENGRGPYLRTGKP